MRYLVLINANKGSEASILPGKKNITEIEKFNGEMMDPSSRDEGANTDYSEEAIPERDPSYRLLDGTHHEAQTVEEMPSDVRLALARCLEQLGMSAVRASLVASL